MKKIFVLLITFLVIVLADAPAMGSLDFIKDQEARNDSGNAPVGVTRKRPVVAIALFAPFNGVTLEEALRVRQAFSVLLGNTGLVDIKNQAFVDQTLIKHNLQNGDTAGWADANKREAFGRALNADWIVQGQVQKIGDNLLAYVSFFNETFISIGSASVVFPPTADPMEHIQPLVDGFVYAINSGGKSYKVGDKGPAGGIIFFIKGDTKEGWRYLEAAPFDLGPAQWGFYGRYGLAGGYEYHEEDNNLGRGKRNTETIVKNHNPAVDSDCAALLCAKFKLNGFDDWFLPSRGELSWLYETLVNNNSGGHKDTFQHNSYWSSSEVNEQHAYLQGFKGEWKGAIVNFMDKTARHGVRPIRAF